MSQEATDLYFTVSRGPMRRGKEVHHADSIKGIAAELSLRRSIQSFTSPEQGAGTSHPLLVFTVIVLLTLFAIVEFDLHSVQLQAIGLLNHGTGVDPVFLSP